MRRMSVNPTLVKSVKIGTDEGYWFENIELNAIYELRYGPYFEDPEWDFGWILIDTHVESGLYGFVFEDGYNGFSWPVRIDWNKKDKRIGVVDLWTDNRTESSPKWKLQLWRVA